MKKICILLAFLISMSLGLVAYEFQVQPITSADLSQERDLFMKFHGIVSENSEFLSQEFDQEEHIYKNPNSQSLFYHAIYQGFVVGYISFEVGPNYTVFIRQLAIDLEMGEPIVLIRELLYTIFQAVPQVSLIALVANLEREDIVNALEELGFEHEENIQERTFGTYGLFVTTKCKICDVLYGPNFWYGNGTEDDWGSPVSLQNDDISDSAD
ncbi:MAG TPA: hypothetical protein VLG50_06360 [Candidatus Saccharimonadales bacterium]|nr:hypothetical protein [Candidatus Saccharimonadales bacterium]